MELLKLFKAKRIWTIILIFLLFILFITSLFVRNTIPSFYVFSIFFMILVFIFSQYLDFDYKLFILFALILFIFFFFSIVVKGRSGLAESFGNYIILLLVFSVTGFYLDSLKQILEKKGKIRLYKTAFLYILFAFLILSVVIFIKDIYNNAEYASLIKKSVLSSAEAVKSNYMRAFDKDKYYTKKESVIINSKRYQPRFIIGIDYPKEGSISGSTVIKGFAIEASSTNNTGIDRLEFFLDGKPGDGKYLGKYMAAYKAQEPTIELVDNLYLSFYNRHAQEDETIFWAANLEWHVISYQDMISIFINSSKILENVSNNQEYLAILYRVVLSREIDGEGLKFWIDKLNSGTSRTDILNSLMDSGEFSTLSDNYYSQIETKKPDYDLVRKDIGDKYGKQFSLSGFSFIINCTKFKDGQHILYVYAHSPVFGWDYAKTSLVINNNTN
jgi:hypothetical protein